MADGTLDDNGRLTVPTERRERDGDRYHIVELHASVEPVLVAEDTLATHRDEFADVETAASELREDARESALDEAGRWTYEETDFLLALVEDEDWLGEAAETV